MTPSFLSPLFLDLTPRQSVHWSAMAAFTITRKQRLMATITISAAFFIAELIGEYSTR